jgi:predicted small integral membrane protein
LTIATLRGDRDLFLATSGALEIRLALVGTAIQGEPE